MFFPCHKCHNEFIEKQNADVDINDSDDAVQEHPQATSLDAVCFKCTQCEKLFESREVMKVWYQNYIEHEPA